MVLCDSNLNKKLKIALFHFFVDLVLVILLQTVFYSHVVTNTTESFLMLVKEGRNSYIQTNINIYSHYDFNNFKC